MYLYMLIFVSLSEYLYLYFVRLDFYYVTCYFKYLDKSNLAMTSCFKFQAGNFLAHVKMVKRDTKMLFTFTMVQLKSMMDSVALV